MVPHRVLIAGIGNIFMGDDAFGCEVAQRLLRRSWPDSVKVMDFGIRGLDLAYALLDGYPTTILVDATPQGHPPGTVSLMKLQAEDVGRESVTLNAHSMHPVNVLRMVQMLGGAPGQILLVGCEPSTNVSDDESVIEMSEAVRAAVDVAVQRIEALVYELLETADPSWRDDECHQEIPSDATAIPTVTT
jgi:hydrogenase maturation protease